MAIPTVNGVHPVSASDQVGSSIAEQVVIACPAVNVLDVPDDIDAVTCGLLADLAGFVSAVLVCYFFFG